KRVVQVQARPEDQDGHQGQRQQRADERPHSKFSLPISSRPRHSWRRMLGLVSSPYAVSPSACSTLVTSTHELTTAPPSKSSSMDRRTASSRLPFTCRPPASRALP